MTTDHEPWRETVLRCLHGERCGSFHSAIDICLAPSGLELMEQAQRSYEAGAASREAELEELRLKVQYLLDLMCVEGMLNRAGIFAFPDGDVWTTSKAKEQP